MNTLANHIRGLALAALCVATNAWGQGTPAEPTWIPFDTSPPGTPADITFDEDETVSGANTSFFEVDVHGYWMTEKISPTGEPFQQIEIPGLGRANVPGAPLLPVARVELAVPTDASVATLISAELLDVRSVTGVNVWPQPIPQLDHEQGEPEVFQYDPLVYRLDELWPAEDAGSSTPVQTTLGHIRSARCEINVARWNPTTGELLVVAHGRYGFSHGGATMPAQPMTRERGELAAARFVNWPVVSDYLPVNDIFYEGLYLIIYPEAYEATLTPFVTHKLSRGLWVTKRKLEDIGDSCQEIRDAIAAWYDSTAPEKDHYCLLVGDEPVIPLCIAPDAEYSEGTLTDDLYGSVNGDDLLEEVFVGRISMDDEADLAHQLDKIIHYETTPEMGWNRKQAVLVAHKEDAPGKYQAAHETVRNFPFNNQPQFITRYGAQGATDAAVSDDIDGGVGIVAYRGHGSSTSWTGWNLANEYFDATDVNGLTNGMSDPVVWSFACTNSYLPNADCFAERWMESTTGGAVSFYGATRASYTDPNHSLDLAMFKSVFHGGLTTQGQAICHAEWKMEQLWYDDNSWMYLLLGDPSMEIQSDDGVLDLVAPPEVEPGGGIVNITVLDDDNDPVPGALVALYKPGTDPEAPEVFINRYADENGMVSIPISPATIGTMHVSVRDEAGRVTVGTVEVVDDAVAVPDAPVADVRLAAAPSVFRTGTVFSFGTSLTGDARMLVVDASGRLVQRLEIPAGAASIRWDGADRAGRRVAPGVYLARLDRRGVSQVTRVVVLR